VEGVTFAPSPAPRLYDESVSSSMLGTLKEQNSYHEEPVTTGTPDDKSGMSTVKRNLEGILKSPSSKRCRAKSCSDVSTGPSPYASHLSAGGRLSSLLSSSATSSWAYECNTQPLIPQPSLYQSSVGDRRPDFTTAPRRLVTDLILTLNASFPDYDFSAATVSEFRTLSVPSAVRSVNSNLGEFVSTTDPGVNFLPRLWSSVDDVLGGGLRDASCYTYSPATGGDDDPLEFLTVSMADDADDISYQETARILNGLDTTRQLTVPSANGSIAGRVGEARHPARVTLWSMNYFFVSRDKKRIVLLACVEATRTPRGSADSADGEGYDDEYAENDVVFDEARQENHASWDEEGQPLSQTPEKTDCRLDDDLDVDTNGEDEEQGDGADFDTGNMSAPSRGA